MTTGDGARRVSWWAALRRGRRPAAFRIGEPAWDHARRRRLEALLDDASTPVDRVPEPEPTAHTEPRVGPAALDEKSLATVATTVWRARRRLERDGAGSRETRQLRTLLRSAQEALAEAGVEVQDHDGAVFDSGYSLEVLAFEPDAGLDVETVRETLRPSVYLGDRRIQMAQVIVGQPAGGATSGG